MVERREPESAVAFIDDYCQTYRNLSPDVRNFEAFKFVHLGICRLTDYLGSDQFLVKLGFANSFNVDGEFRAASKSQFTKIWSEP